MTTTTFQETVYPRLACLFISIFIFSGCVSNESDYISTDSTINVPEDELQGINIVAPTLGRDVDKSSTFDILNESGNNSTLLIWVSTQCRGCHLWTEMIRECFENGTIPQETNVVTVHRYPSFENFEDVNQTYDNISSQFYSPWPVITPQNDAVAWNADSQTPSNTTIISAFNTPSTPTLQILNSGGEIIWQSKTYNPNFEVIEKILVEIA